MLFNVDTNQNNKNGIDEDEYTALCERADFFGMESLTEKEQCIILRHTDK